MFIFILLVACILPLIYLELKTYKIKQIVKHTSGPKTLPLVGNAHQTGKTPSEILDNFFTWFYKYKQDNYTVWIGPYLNIVVSNVKDVEFILSSNSLIQKSDIYDMLHPWLGEGLLTSTGAKWHKHRKMITPSFHFKILQDFHAVMNENCNKFVEKLKNVAKGDTIIDFQDQAHYLTLDVICDTAMGVHINAMDNHDAEIVNAFKDMCYNINMRAFHPLKRNDSIYRFFPDYKDFCKTLKTLQDFTYEVIEKRIERRKQEEVHKTETVEDEFSKRKMAFLDTLLSSTIDGRPLNTQEIYEEVSTFIFEGHDTTTSGVTFAIYLLSRHLGVQQQVYEEQQRVMGGNMKRDASFQELSEMKYLDLVLKEAQRLYPSVPMIGRFTEKDYNINGKPIPKNTSLNIFIMALGYNDKSFPDPYRFKPERFDLTQRTEKQNPFEYVPFSAGPRNCIGQKFAQLEIKTVVSKIVRNFEILPALDELASKDGYVSTFLGPQKHNKPQQHKYEPILSAVLTLKSENGVHLRLKERN
ncbi:cytochrome P450 4e2-like [Lucilia sericata]|uniref:cytochrome P450 4e2-like n=1 Tax=Lucilia sericata TaxID=13632 RepID=UPI0018A81C8C|nr:cytochrome P450 4e2-like [Lucilia sericata]